MILQKILKLNPLQEFRHRVYLPMFSFLGSINDFFRGINTERIIELDEVGIDKTVGSRSETISYGKLKSVLSFARTERFDRLCDIGCGLGRSFIVGKECGFSEFYGVDISPEIIDLCKINLSKKNISGDLKSCDVDDYSLPSGKLAIYLFNPFGLEKMNELVDKISKRDSDTLVIYFNPKHHKVFKESLKIKEIVWNHWSMYREMVYFYRFPPSS